jgi:hypothetical protein
MSVQEFLQQGDAVYAGQFEIHDGHVAGVILLSGQCLLCPFRRNRHITCSLKAHPHQC